MIVLFIARLLDILTTYLNVGKWGWGVEGNPIISMIGNRGLFIPYQFFMFGLIVIIAELLPKYRKIIYISLSAISLMVAISNLFCFIYIK